MFDPELNPGLVKNINHYSDNQWNLNIDYGLDNSIVSILNSLNLINYYSYKENVVLLLGNIHWSI